MKISAVAFAAVLASTASAQKGVAPQRLRSSVRFLKDDKEDTKDTVAVDEASAPPAALNPGKEGKNEDPADEEITPLADSVEEEVTPLAAGSSMSVPGATSLSMSLPIESSVSMSMSTPANETDMEPLSAEASLSMSLSMLSVPAVADMYAWGNAPLTALEFDVGSLSMSMPVKCDKKCQKEKLKAEAASEPEFSEWGAAALTPFAFDASMSMSMPVKCDKRCQKDKLKNRRRRMKKDEEETTAEDPHSKGGKEEEPAATKEDKAPAAAGKDKEEEAPAAAGKDKEEKPTAAGKDKEEKPEAAVAEEDAPIELASEPSVEDPIPVVEEPTPVVEAVPEEAEDFASLTGDTPISMSLSVAFDVVAEPVTEDFASFDSSASMSLSVDFAEPVAEFDIFEESSISVSMSLSVDFGALDAAVFDSDTTEAASMSLSMSAP